MWSFWDSLVAMARKNHHLKVPPLTKETMGAASNICATCARLDVLDGIQRRALTGDSGEDQTETSGLFWHKNLIAVDKSATSCALCALIVKGWKEARQVIVEEGIKSGNFDLENPPKDLHFDIMDIEAYRQIGVGAVTVEIGHRASANLDSWQMRDVYFLSFKCKVVGSQGSWEAHDELVADFRVAFDPDAVVGSDAPTGDPQASATLLQELVAIEPLSQRSLKIANSWLEACLRDHGEACGSPSFDAMPTRVLDVSPDGKICLKVCQNTNQNTNLVDRRYAALSHCWGTTDTPFITTVSNLERRMEGIDFDEMPKTFQDAITVVKNLGLRYLWIDSLCIIQQDLEDWQIESAKMASIYRGAYLVLGAAAGLSDESGFLGPRLLHGTINLSSDSSTSIYLQLLPPGPRRWTYHGRDAPDPLVNEPLTGRAWCLQERYLSKRALQYGSRQMFWECQRIKISEDGDAVARNGDYLKSLCATSSIKESVFYRENRDPGSETRNVKWIDWYQMLEDYTSRGITSAADKLPAVAGLASVIAESTDENEYMAGLWRTGLIEGLTWCRKTPDQLLDKPEQYIAPSWSWASVQGPVQFPIYHWHLTRAPWKSRMADFEPLAEYIRHDIELMDKDVYGRLQMASLCIKAPLINVVSVRPRPSEQPSVQFVFGQGPNRSPVTDKVVELQLDQGQTIFIDGGFDLPVKEDIHDLAVVFLTRLPHIFEDGFVEHRFGLLVEKMDNGYYRRVGFVDGSILETHQAAISRWRKHTPQSLRHKAKHDNEEELNKSIAKGLAWLDALELSHKKSRALSKLEILGYPRNGEEDDVYEVEPPNKMAQNPLHFDDVELTLCPMVHPRKMALSHSNLCGSVRTKISTPTPPSLFRLTARAPRVWL
ncbi:heterokaryon incompatibility protein-domain-containing protein [Dactylonectria macrodidyma]|uniref:Heterokaryon incompatibility protein-domain-containing protein n=1 Tax=Dactylonectria macrodidyma TaxID=307937 RepID=A0A9P9E6U0_9HYPO|nr:heterokaryon incompatibility protein-domain-containing protein [Dactylonectria macrodidyma]